MKVRLDGCPSLPTQRIKQSPSERRKLWHEGVTSLISSKLTEYQLSKLRGSKPFRFAKPSKNALTLKMSPQWPRGFCFCANFLGTGDEMSSGGVQQGTVKN